MDEDEKKVEQELTDNSTGKPNFYDQQAQEMYQNDRANGESENGQGAVQALAETFTEKPKNENTVPEGFVKTQSEIDNDPDRKEIEDEIAKAAADAEEQERLEQEQAARDAKWQDAVARYQSLFDDAADKVARGTTLSPEEEKKERKKEIINKSIAGIGDMVSAFSNLATTSKWAPNVFDPKETMSDAMYKRYEDLRKERQEKAKQYYDAVLNRYKTDAQIQRMDDDRWYKRESIKERQRNTDIRAEIARLNAEKEESMKGFRKSMEEKNYATAKKYLEEVRYKADAMQNEKEKTKALVQYYNSLSYLNSAKANKEKKGTTTLKYKVIKTDEEGNPIKEKGKFVYDYKTITVVNGSPEANALNSDDNTIPGLRK
jgi:hypothetical protein